MLNPEQRAAVSSGAACTLVSACPGSGKTTVVVARALAMAQPVTCMSFTVQSAAEVTRRLQGAPHVTVGTMHSVAKAALEEEHGGGPIELVGAEEQRRMVEEELPPGGDADAALRAYGLCACSGPERPYELFAQDEGVTAALRSYDRRKGARADFDDLLTRWCGLLAARRPAPGAMALLPAEVLVDEFQDMNPLQLTILQHLRRLGCRLFCVGDCDQAIYGFRGATTDGVMRFEERFPGADVLRLQTNYRSTPEVVGLAAAFGASPMAAAAATAPGQPPRFHLFGAAQEELAWLVGRPPAVMLFRTNAQLRAMEADLRLAGLRADVLGADPVAEDTVRGLWELLAGDPWADPDAGLTREEARTLRPLVRRLRRAQSALQELPPQAEAGGRAWLLGTVHQAKGMEFDTVHLPGLLEGNFPLRTESPEEQAEERRVFYVAVTRCRHELHASCSATNALQVSEFVRRRVAPVDHRPAAAPAAAAAVPGTCTYTRRR